MSSRRLVALMKVSEVNYLEDGCEYIWYPLPDDYFGESKRANPYKCLSVYLGGHS